MCAIRDVYVARGGCRGGHALHLSCRRAEIISARNKQSGEYEVAQTVLVVQGLQSARAACVARDCCLRKITGELSDKIRVGA